MAEVHELMAEEWSMQVLKFIKWVGERKGFQDVVPFTVKWRALVCAS